MRRLSLILLLLSCLTAVAQDNYKKVLTPGKVWKCLVVRDYVSDVVKKPYTVTVECDTIVDNRKCWKMSSVYDDSGQPASYWDDIVAYEENGKVYAYKHPLSDNIEGDWTLMLDFTLHKGDVATEFGSIVTEEDSVEVNGILYRRLSITGGYWVEGIGPNTDYWRSNIAKPTHMETREMLACYENGKLLFSKDDFDKEAYKRVENGVNSITVQKGEESATYDMGGRRINAPRKGDIYIQDGMKRMAR